MVSGRPPFASPCPPGLLDGFVKLGRLKADVQAGSWYDSLRIPLPPSLLPGASGLLVRGIENGDGMPAPDPDGGSGPLVRGGSGIEGDAGIPMPELPVFPIRSEGNGPLVEGVTTGRLVGPDGSGPLVRGGSGPLVAVNGSGPLVTFGTLGCLAAESRSSGSGWTGAFERGSAEVARPFATVGFT